MFTVLPKAAPRFPPPRGSLAYSLSLLQREDLELIAQAAIDELDAREGDVDREDGDVDCCPAGDDDVGNPHCSFGRGDGYPGDPDDAEDGHDAEAVNEDGSEEEYRTLPTYGVDQSRGPINERAASREWQYAIVAQSRALHQVHP